MLYTSGMNQHQFNKAMEFLGYQPGDKKHAALQLVLVGGLSQAAASKLTGYSTPQLSTVIRRVRRELQRVTDLTGVTLL